ncbi:MAG: response regulator transcription factor [Gammaproteobacteria bacterium]
MNHTILAIDKEKGTWGRIEAHLRSKGYRLLFAYSEQHGLQILQTEPIDLVLLNEGIADNDYLEIIRTMKEHSVVPVIVLAKKSSAVERVTGLELGADDFITSPIDIEELSARIKANLRLVDRVRLESEPGQQQNNISAIVFNGWRLDLQRRQLLDAEGNLVSLTPGEFRLLEILARSSGVALSRERLFAATRDRDAMEFDRSIDVQISRLRQKLDDDQQSNPLIRTIREFGYMLDVKTEKIR